MDATLTNRPPVATKQPGQQRITEALSAYRSSRWVEAMEHASYSDSERLVAFLRNHDPEEGWGALLPLGATAEQIMYATGLDRRRYTVAMHAVESYCAGPGDKYLVVSRVSGADAYRMMSSLEILRGNPGLEDADWADLPRRLRGPIAPRTNRTLIDLYAGAADELTNLGCTREERYALLLLAVAATELDWPAWAGLDHLAAHSGRKPDQVIDTVWRLASRGLLTLTRAHDLEPVGTLQYELHWPARPTLGRSYELTTAVAQ